MKKIVFAGDRLFMKFPELGYFQERAREADARVVAVHTPDDEAFIGEVRDASAIAVIARKLTANIIRRLERCELILTFSVGYDCVDRAAASEKGIPVCNTPAYCSDEVANHAMTLILALARKIPLIIPVTKSAGWDYAFTRPIYNFRGKNFGIIGLGKIGRKIVAKARGFGMKVMAYDPYVEDDIYTLLAVERKYELSDLLREADYLTIHAPLTPETFHMIDERTLSMMKPHAVLVNTARGSIIHHDALVHALEEGKIAGAGIDVLEKEPPAPDNPLLALPNALVTPHVAWYSEESHRADMEQGMDEIIRVLSGRRPRYITNPEIFGRNKDWHLRGT
jgi:D-3-phosphoglycerate dehydrogenase